jgi:hypothetical protein
VLLGVSYPPVQGEHDYYSVEEAAAVLGMTPARVLQMLTAGELEGLPPGATTERAWKVLLPVAPERDPAPGQAPPTEESPEDLESAPEPPEEAAGEEEQPEAARTGETTDETPDEGIGETDEELREDAGSSGWTTTKQAAKVLDVSRRSVQGYVRRGLLKAREEGAGVNKRFLISIDSLNELLDRRRRDADAAAKFAGASGEAEQAANLYASTGEALRHAIERVEARTAEATELRVRLEITERAQSTLREELAEERRRREEAERVRDDLRRELDTWRRLEESAEATAHEIHDRLAEERSGEEPPASPEPREEPEIHPVRPERAEPAEPVGPQREEPERLRLERVEPERTEPRESPVTAVDEQQGRGPIPDAGGPHEGTQRPWWRRMFGGRRQSWR